MPKWAPLPNDKPSAVWITMSLVGQLGFQIAVPLVIFTLIGKKLDNHFGTLPLFLLTAMGLAMVVSSYQVYKIIKKVNSGVK
jgi:F0F1-type ATP synthase assembly protein I